MNKTAVVIPTYNRPYSMVGALDSVVKSSRRAGIRPTIVIVNDGSSESYSWARQELNDKSVVYIELPENKGVASARNVGVKAIDSCDWITFLDDDDKLSESYFVELEKAMKKRPGASAFFTGARIYDGVGCNSYSDRAFSETEKDDYRVVKDFLSAGTGFGFTVRREVFTDIGGFDTDFPVGEDTEFFFRLLCEDYIPSIIPGVNVIKFEGHGNRLCKNFYAYSKMNIYDRILSKYENTMLKIYRKNFIHMLMWAYRVHSWYDNGQSKDLCMKKLNQLGVPGQHVLRCFRDDVDISESYLGLT